MQFSPDGSRIVSGGIEDKTLKVWDAGTPARPIPHLAQNLSAPTLAAASLELNSEKQSAHSDSVRSVAFSPDGKTVVSGSDDKSLKVWDAINFRPHVESEWEQFNKTIEAEDSDEEDEVEELWRNKVTGHEQATKPSGGAPLGHW